MYTVFYLSTRYCQQNYFLIKTYILFRVLIRNFPDFEFEQKHSSANVETAICVPSGRIVVEQKKPKDLKNHFPDFGWKTYQFWAKNATVVETALSLFWWVFSDNKNEKNKHKIFLHRFFIDGYSDSEKSFLVGLSKLLFSCLERHPATSKFLKRHYKLIRTLSGNYSDPYRKNFNRNVQRTFYVSRRSIVI